MQHLGPTDEDAKKRKKVMQGRLKKLGADNPVVKKAIAKIEPDEAYEDFEIVHDLVSAAFSKYAEGEGSLKKCLVNLANAIKGVAGKMDSNDTDEDY